ncbi:hypothetical protein ACFPK9_01230 [Rubritalea spongiae]|uniref:DUF1320 domain-containing protein n=1 Tax=Rubritalea spongiae TaxID=430797 RepID=A0ABW5DZ30_9BACT
MWRELTDEDVLNGLNAAELVAYRRIQANEDGSDGDVLPEIMEAVVMECRGRIAACSKNKLADRATLPVALVRYRLLTRLGLSVKSAREVEYKDARSFLSDVSRCMVAIPAPSGADDTAQWYPRPTHTKRPQQFNRASQDGI